MALNRALLLLLLLAAPGSAAVRLSVSPGPLSPEAVARTEAAAAKLLEYPVRDAHAQGLVLTASSWKAGLAPAERERLLQTLSASWGRRLAVREDAAAGAGVRGLVPPPSALDFRGRTDAIRARLDAAPRPLDRSGQDRFYDGGRSAEERSVSAGAPSARPRFAFAAAAPRPAAAVPPAPSAPKASEPISWKKAGVEVLKGAGHAIKDVFTWKGLAIAAGSVALVTVAPVAIYGLLALGAVFSVYTIGKAVVDGRAAYKAGDAQKFYGASQEMGRGLLGLTLTALGARHLPTNLRPHFPSTSGEWRAMAAAMDDEPVIAVSLLRDRPKKP
ncbi:MAG: hypothetical protein HYV14_04235 [Elusimicrobia bacterium]|nr:hypothetical protein [Elusimicrobiota bacterium]